MTISKQDLVKKYDAYYERNPEKWAGVTGETRDRFAFETLSSFLSEPPHHVLEIGCGNGHTLEYFHNRWPDASYTGVDLSPVAIALARKRFWGAKYFVGSHDDPQFFDWNGNYDCILSLGVFEHFEELHKGLMAVRSLLGIPGVLYAEMPNCIGYPKSEKVEGFRELNTGNRQYEWHLYRESWDREFRDAGFKIEKSLVGPMIETEFCYVLSGVPFQEFRKNRTDVLK